MRTFLISYDLASPNRNKHVLANAIMGLGRSWARPLEHTWFVRADINESDIEARLAMLLDTDDGLIVQAVAEIGALTNTSLRWFRQRRPAVDLEATADTSNVITFPLPAIGSDQTELPLSRAS
jgi:hypothetical protein